MLDNLPSCRVSLLASIYSSWVSALCNVNWYVLFDERPPTRMACGSVMKTRTPGNRASFGRNVSRTCALVRARWRRGLSCRKMRPVLEVLP
jgi:hypothetical protein